MTKTYSYDASGNNTAIVATLATGGASTTQETVTMDYDGLNRMTSWSRAASGATLQTETHCYRGAEWHRRSTTANGVSTSFLYDGDNVLVDYVTTGGGGSTFDRLYVIPILDQNLSMTLAAGASGNTSGSEQTYYYSQDGLGSVRTLTDASGMLVNNYDYMAFGEAYQPGTSVSVQQRYTYTGREQSVYDLAPMYYRWRMYDVAVGRFEARDPIGYKGSPSGGLYAYTEGNPIELGDPFGEALPTYAMRGETCYNMSCLRAVSTEALNCLSAAGATFGVGGVAGTLAGLMGNVPGAIIGGVIAASGLIDISTCIESYNSGRYGCSVDDKYCCMDDI